MKHFLILFAILIFSSSSFAQMRPYKKISTVAPFSVEEMKMLMEMAKEKNNVKVEEMKMLIEMAKENNVKVESNERQKVIANMYQIKSIYSKINNFPTKIIDGWHNIISTNNYDFCDSRKVYVLNNLIVKYVIDNWAERIVTFSSQINQGKGLIKLNDNESEYLDIYFIDFCINPNSLASPPIKP